MVQDKCIWLFFWIDFLRKNKEKWLMWRIIWYFNSFFSPKQHMDTKWGTLCESVRRYIRVSSPQLSCCRPVIQTCQNWSWWSFLVQPRWPTHSSESLYSSQATPGTEWHQTAPSSGPHKELRGQNIGTVNKWECIKRREIKGEQKLGFCIYKVKKAWTTFILCLNIIKHPPFHLSFVIPSADICPQKSHRY